MAAVSSPSDQVAGALQNLSIGSQNMTSANTDISQKDIYGNNETPVYHQSYCYPSFGTYTSPNSTASTIGNDGQLYGTQQYQYPSPFYQAAASTGPLYSPNSGASQTEVPALSAIDKATLSVGAAAGNPSNTVNSGNVNISDGAKPFRPSYHDPYGYTRFQSGSPWFDVSMYSNGPHGHGFSSPMNFNSLRPISGLGQASGTMGMMYPQNRMHGQYGYRAGAGFGSYGGNSWTNGRGWVVVDNNYKPKGRFVGNENMDGLSELNIGPRARGFKNQTELGDVAEAVLGQKLPRNENIVDDNMSQVPDKEQYNKDDFQEDYSNAKFFVIKSYSEDDVHKSIKYGVWASTPNGNKKLDAAYSYAKGNSAGCPVFLLFSVNTSGQFVGLAEMVGPVDFNITVEYWQQEKWIGCFPVKWHIIKDVPNSSLRHITLENNENKPVTNSRDTQEVIVEKGIQILKIFKGHKGNTSILDDFGFYAARERTMQEKRAKQKIQKQVLDGKSGDDLSVSNAIGATLSQNSIDSVLKEPVAKNGEVKLVEENGSGAGVDNSAKNTKSVVSSESKVVNVVASAC